MSGYSNQGKFVKKTVRVPMVSRGPVLQAVEIWLIQVFGISHKIWWVKMTKMDLKRIWRCWCTDWRKKSQYYLLWVSVISDDFIGHTSLLNFSSFLDKFPAIFEKIPVFFWKVSWLFFLPFRIFLGNFPAFLNRFPTIFGQFTGFFKPFLTIFGQVWRFPDSFRFAKTWI